MKNPGQVGRGLGVRKGKGLKGGFAAPDQFEGAGFSAMGIYT